MIGSSGSISTTSEFLSLLLYPGFEDRSYRNCRVTRFPAGPNTKRDALFTELLGQLRFDDEVLEWVCDALRASHADDRREQEEAIKRHQAEQKRCRGRVNAMYVDKLSGMVDATFYEKECRTNGARRRTAAGTN